MSVLKTLWQAPDTAFGLLMCLPQKPIMQKPHIFLWSLIRERQFCPMKTVYAHVFSCIGIALKLSIDN